MDRGAGTGGGSSGANVTLDRARSPRATRPTTAHRAATPTDGGNNLSFPDTTCPGLNVDPQLGDRWPQRRPDAHARARPGSGALDKVPGLLRPADQRGFARPIGAGCDIGAFELGPPAAATGAASGDHDRGARSPARSRPRSGRRPATSSTARRPPTAPARPTPTPAAPPDRPTSPPTSPASPPRRRTTTASSRRTADGTAVGADQTFTTAPSAVAPRAAGPPRRRAS